MIESAAIADSKGRTSFGAIMPTLEICLSVLEHQAHASWIATPYLLLIHLACLQE